MLRKVCIPAIAILSVIVLHSCGTKKKLQTTTNDLNTMIKKNGELTKQNEQLTQDVATLQGKYNSMSSEYDKYKADCAEAEEHLRHVQEILNEGADNLAKVEEKLETALANFNEKGVDVYRKDGILYVSLSDDLLYKSGSAKLGTDARKALGSLASVLNDYPRLKVIVLGNTDDQQFKKGSDNWTLSTERANGVVRILREYNVEPSRLTAAGKAKFNPIADNSTAEGRAQNRRTEIILNPDFERLWQEAKNE